MYVPGRNSQHQSSQDAGSPPEHVACQTISEQDVHATSRRGADAEKRRPNKA